MTVEHLVERANKAEDEDERTGFLERACEIAAKLAPYVHPRLSAIAYKSEAQPEKTRLLEHMTDDELIERLQAGRDRAMPAAGDIRDGLPS